MRGDEMAMNRITMHHSGGPPGATSDDIEAYHRLVEDDGRVVSGKHRIEANAPGKRLRWGFYAAHTKGLNTGNIGVALCSMGGSRWSDPFSAETFPTEVQVRAMVAEVARLCRQYGIAVTRRTVLSHAEVEPTLGVRQDAKWDFDYDPFGRNRARDPIQIGDDLRAMIRGAMGETPEPQPEPRRMIRQGDRGETVRVAQEAVGATPDGIFGPLTRAAVVAFQEAHDLLPDGIVGPMTWGTIEGEMQ